MAAVNPFPASSIGITVAATSTALTAVALPVVTGCNQLRVVNEGPSPCFFATGASTVAAPLPTTGAGVNTCNAILPGEDAVFSIGSADLYISTICRTAGTATLSVYVGNGL